VNRGTPARAVLSGRTRLVAAGVLALAVLAGGGLYLAHGVFSASPSPGRGLTSALTIPTGCGATATGTDCASGGAMALAAAPAVVTVPPGHMGSRQHPTKAATLATASPSSSASPSASVAATPGASPTSSADQDGAPSAQVLALINQARASAGLPALTITAGLETTSSAHNLLMADGCGLSHQCPGEPAIGARETAAGIDWTAAGENIGEGGPVADTSAAIASMAVGLTQSMLDEKPPNDGHRLNILSTSFTHIGIAVYRDSSGTVWLTQDFSN